MAAQKRKKNFRQNVLAFLNIYYPETHLIKALYSLDSSRLHKRLMENPKQGPLGICLSESNFKTSSTVNFPKRHPHFGGLETNQRHKSETRNLFGMPYYTQYIIKIVLGI